MADFYAQCAGLYPVPDADWPRCFSCHANPYLCPHDHAPEYMDALEAWLRGREILADLAGWLVTDGGYRPPAPRPIRAYTGPSLIEEIKSRLRIEDVAERLTELKGRGKRLKGRCPFHADNSPSFYVFTDTQKFHCFGCQLHGDVIDMARAADERGLSYG